MTHPFGSPGDAASSPLQCSESRAVAGLEQDPDGAKVSFAHVGVSPDGQSQEQAQD